MSDGITPNISDQELQTAIGDIFSNLLTQSKNESESAWENDPNYKLNNLIDKVKDSPSSFDFEIHRNYEEVHRGFIRKNISTQEQVEFILLNYNFLERHFEGLFTKIDGRACCVDKARFMLRIIYSKFKDQKSINNELNEKGYWLSKKIMLSESEILNFYYALTELRYGNSDDFITLMTTKYKV